MSKKPPLINIEDEHLFYKQIYTAKIKELEAQIEQKRILIARYQKKLAKMHDPDIPPDNNFAAFMRAFSQLAAQHKNEVSLESLYMELEHSLCFTRYETSACMARAQREGLIYERKPGYFAKA